MADGTKIEWSDATWNPITGCEVLSPGCKNCYAMKLAGTRLKHHPSRAGLTHESAAGPVWTGDVRFNEEWLLQPLQWTRPRQIFVVAHGDLFHKNVPDAWIDKVFAVMALAKHHTFQVLTKRARRMREYFATPGRAERITLQVLKIETSRGCPRCTLVKLPLPHVWLGVSAERQQEADERIVELLATRASVRWVSFEPLLGAIDVTEHLWGRAQPCDACPRDADCECGFAQRREITDEPALDWAVVGGESGDGARPMHVDWARSLRDQLSAAGVPMLFKQWGNWIDHDQPGVDMLGSEASPLHQWDDGKCSVRLSKKAAGRLLDGVLHDGYPKVRP
jgi:protein gp37